MKALILAMLMAAPAFAADTVVCGTTFARVEPSRNAVAEVHITNEFAQGPAYCDGIIELGGLQIKVKFTNNKGEEPDTIEVFPPVGFVAIPESLTLEEYRSGVVEIFADGGLTS